jgi:6-phosphogluconolactonase/glucosamine-6-phosphate isomerase/deaminase
MKDLRSSRVLSSWNKQTRQGLLIVRVADHKEGSDLAKNLLYEITDNDTLLFLSGGKTPEYLYSELAREQASKIGAASMVDERFGRPLHENSNELMIKKSGLWDYFTKAGIPFYPILSSEKSNSAGQSLEKTASNYENTLKDLFTRFIKSVAILGIGEDGHIAGIAPNRAGFNNPLFSPEQEDMLVSYFEDGKPQHSSDGIPIHGFGKRITMTFKGLSQMDALIILVFGERKKAVLLRLFEEGPLEDVPARFIKGPVESRKTILITDQTGF